MKRSIPQMVGKAASFALCFSMVLCSQGTNTRAAESNYLQELAANEAAEVVADDGDISMNRNMYTLPTEVTIDGLVRHLSFDGNATDTLGNETTSSGVEYVPGVNGGQAALFDTTTSFVSLGKLQYPKDADFSFSMWLKKTTPGGDGAMVSNKNWDSGSNPGFSFATVEEQLWFNARDEGMTVGRVDANRAGAIVGDKNWHHVVLTVDRTNGAVTFYVDGVQTASTLDISQFKDLGFDSPYPTNIGNDGRGVYSPKLGGAIDDFRMYNKVLTETEAKSLNDAMNYVPAPGITAISVAPKTNNALNVGGQVTLTASISPVSATETLVWEAMNGVNTVTLEPSADGRTCVVTAAKAGSAKVIARTEDGKVAGSALFSIINKASGVSILGDKSVQIEKGDQLKVLCEVLSQEASNKTVIWKSSNPQVATIGKANMNRASINAITPGKTTITVKAQDGSFTDSIEVETVVQAKGMKITSPSVISLTKGKTTQMTTEFNPIDATNQTITWVSSNPKIATVSSTGVVTGLAKGLVVVTATSEDGHFSNTRTVKVS